MRIKSVKSNNEWVVCSSKRKSTKILARFHDLMANDMQTMDKNGSNSHQVLIWISIYADLGYTEIYAVIRLH